MSSEIIQSVAYDNYDDFQHDNFIFYTKFHFTILRIENYILYINSLRSCVCDKARVRHRRTTRPGPALPEEESRRRNKGKDAQLPQPQRPELHHRAPTPGFIHLVSFTRSTPQSHPPGLLTRAWVAEPNKSTGSS